VRQTARDQLVPRGLPHILSDDPRTPGEPYERALDKMRARLAAPASMASPETTTLLCAEIKFDDDGPHPLMMVLPEVVHLAADVAENDDGLRLLSQVLLREAASQHAGRELVVPRLIDTLLVYIVRSFLERQPLESAGWLGALRDPQIGRALSAIHEAPARRFTVSSLASGVGMSRAVFARRFVALVGESPLSYVTRWRMNLAAERLRSTDEPLEAIAASVGYESATAFGNAFRRHVSISPGQYRLRQRVVVISAGPTAARPSPIAATRPVRGRHLHRHTVGSPPPASSSPRPTAARTRSASR
jgi:AraC-like DNA-binding protein